jgi:hypothetical protein
MQADGVIGAYAIGGAVGATFYIEPAATMDVDVFIQLHVEPGTIITLTPIFEYLNTQGCVAEGEHIIIADTPVQFLPPPSPLVEEAIANAVQRDIDGTPVQVFKAEFIAAIALELGRTKDKLRLSQFIEADALDMALFETLLTKYKLGQKWRLFKQQFGS